jgi:hypothetical protein
MKISVLVFEDFGTVEYFNKAIKLLLEENNGSILIKDKCSDIINLEPFREKVKQNPDYGFMYGDSLLLGETQVPIYREPFDAHRLMNFNFVGGPVLFNLQALTLLGEDLIDKNLRIFKLYDLCLRVSKTRIGHHIPKIIATESTLVWSPALLQSEITYLQRKYGVAQ